MRSTLCRTTCCMALLALVIGAQVYQTRIGDDRRGTAKCSRFLPSAPRRGRPPMAPSAVRCAPVSSRRSTRCDQYVTRRRLRPTARALQRSRKKSFARGHGRCCFGRKLGRCGLHRWCSLDCGRRNFRCGFNRWLVNQLAVCGFFTDFTGNETLIGESR